MQTQDVHRRHGFNPPAPLQAKIARSAPSSATRARTDAKMCMARPGLPTTTPAVSMLWSAPGPMKRCTSFLNKPDTPPTISLVSVDLTTATSNHASCAGGIDASPPAANGQMELQLHRRGHASSTTGAVGFSQRGRWSCSAIGAATAARPSASPPWRGCTAPVPATTNRTPNICGSSCGPVRSQAIFHHHTW